MELVTIQKRNKLNAVYAMGETPRRRLPRVPYF